MEKLFKEFNAVSYSEWLEKIQKDLKGKPLEILDNQLESDIEIKAYHHPEHYQLNDADFLRNLTKETADWKIRTEFLASDSNNLVLNYLNEGVNSLGLVYTSTEQFQEQTKEVMFEHIDADIRFESSATACEFEGTSTQILNFDVIGINAKKGNWNLSLDDFYVFFQKQSKHKTLWISGYNYGWSGASTALELGLSLAHLNEYIHLLRSKDVSLEEINNKLVVELSVNDNYFLNIAKFRAIRSLIALLFEGYDSDYSGKGIQLIGKTNLRHLCVNDRNTNLLRQTTQCMSAIIGGCDTVTVDTLRNADGSPVENERRLAKNIQHILKEESYLDKVIDASAGAYAIENLTDQLIEKAWNIFLELEKKNGLIAAIKTNWVTQQIENDRKSMTELKKKKKSTLLGINKFQSTLEDWTAIESHQSSGSGEFEALSEFRLESVYKQKQLSNG